MADSTTPLETWIKAQRSTDKVKSKAPLTTMTHGELSTYCREYLAERFDGNSAADSYRQEMVKLACPKGTDENAATGGGLANLLKALETVVQHAINGLEPLPKLKSASAIGKVHPDALAQLGSVKVTGDKSEVTLDKDMTAAVNSILKGEVRGRSAPGTKVRHLHVGGSGSLNLLFEFDDTHADSHMILGVVNGHIDSKASSTIKSAATAITNRSKSMGGAHAFKLTGAKLAQQ